MYQKVRVKETLSLAFISIAMALKHFKLHSLFKFYSKSLTLLLKLQKSLFRFAIEIIRQKVRFMNHRDLGS